MLMSNMNLLLFSFLFLIAFSCTEKLPIADYALEQAQEENEPIISSSSEEEIALSSSSSNEESSSSNDSSSSSEENNSSSSSDSSSSSEESSSSSLSVSSSSSSEKSSSSKVPDITLNIPASGYYATSVSFTVPEAPDGNIRCETNGNIPTANSSIKSGDALNFTETKVIRCAKFNESIVSKPIMRTYIIGRKPSLPIVSIALAPEEMTSSSFYKSGTGNFDCSGSGNPTPVSEQEVPAQVDFFEGNVSHQWSYLTGLSIHGGCSRAHPKKSVIVSFREEYGQKNLNYTLFPEFPKLQKFKHFMLRNNGNNYDSDYIRDRLMTSLTEGLDIDYQKGRFVVVYYNGEYYGIHDLRERANGDYIETNYNISENVIDFINVDANSLNQKGETQERKGSDADFQDVIAGLGSVSTPLTDAELKELEKRVDINNLTNHYQSRIFYVDRDWPGKNMKRWRVNSPATRWRFLMYDTDHGWGGWGTSYGSQKMLDFITSDCGYTNCWPNPPISTFLIRKLLKNESYKKAFINRFSLLLATYFTTSRISSKISALESSIASEKSYDEAKWGPKYDNRPRTISEFAANRTAEMQAEIESFFVLSTPSDLSLSVSGNGKILIHNLPMPESATIKVYPEVPLTIKAAPNGAAKFANWSDGDTNAERTITAGQLTTLTANFN